VPSLWRAGYFLLMEGRLLIHLDSASQRLVFDMKKPLPPQSSI
jgi:hypothetical protein